jgi:hypothetical protein
LDPDPNNEYNSTIARGEINCDKVFYVDHLGAEQGAQAYPYALMPAGIGDLIESNPFASFYGNGIYYDENYYAPSAPVYFVIEGNWNEANNWSSGVLPTASTNVVIQANATIPSDCLAEAGAVMLDNGKTLTIEDGGQLVHGNAGLTATVKKEITGVGDSWTSDNDGWYFIASPLVAENGINPENVNHLIGMNFDLYRFNGSTMIWENAKANEDDFVLENGIGYLYANKKTVSLEFTGELKPYSEANGDNQVAVPAGWSLIGNPFVCNVYTGRPFYKLNAEGSAIVAVENYATTAVAPCTGIMIYADEARAVTFTKDMQQQQANQGNIQVALSQVPEPVEGPVRYQDGVSTSTTTLLDNAIVSFNEGATLPKFRFGDHAEIYIPQGDEDYAIAYIGRDGVHTVSTEIPLNFKAKKNGEYTLSFNLNGVELGYLHLIDNMTGADIDLLNKPAYTFQANTSDYASRFKLVFATKNEDDPNNNDSFAFKSNGEIIVNGTGTLQVIDLLGHMLLTNEVNSEFRIPNSALSSGVYVLHLIQGENTRTQKIVID